MVTTKLLLLGDSLIDFGNWPNRLPRFSAISSGVPGERSEELLHRLRFIKADTRPDIIVLMSGTNNLLWGDYSFPEVIEEICLELRTQFSRAGIIITSLLPFQIPGCLPHIRKANAEMKETAIRTGGNYFDLYTSFENSSDTLFDYDGVHLNETGYQLWASELNGYLDILLEKDID